MAIGVFSPPIIPGYSQSRFRGCYCGGGKIGGLVAAGYRVTPIGRRHIARPYCYPRASGIGGRAVFFPVVFRVAGFRLRPALPLLGRADPAFLPPGGFQGVSGGISPGRGGICLQARCWACRLPEGRGCFSRAGMVTRHPCLCQLGLQAALRRAAGNLDPIPGRLIIPYYIPREMQAQSEIFFNLFLPYKQV